MILPRIYLIYILLTLEPVLSFVTPQTPRLTQRPLSPLRQVKRCSRMAPQTLLRMSFLPPPDNNKDTVVSTVLKTLGVIAFFASPLGGIVFSIFNSVLVLTIVVPLLAVAAFQVWQSLNTIRGSCPECGAPVTVIKQDAQQQLQSSPSLCLNCGALVQASSSNDAIINARLVENEIPSLLDSLFARSTVQEKQSYSKYRPEDTIIDVEAEDVNMPFR